jgi:hypothetical protein
MSIRLELSTADQEWSFNLTETVIPSTGDIVTLDDSEGRTRDFRVVGRRIAFSEVEPLAVASVAVQLEPS